MALVKRTMIFFLVMAALQLSFATVYKVGDEDGWTFYEGVEYRSWAESKKFHVGDIVRFEYTKNEHNVKQVNRADYHSCNAENPLATYTTGNDSITLKKTGHYYFVCGFPDHCSGGMNVDIRVTHAS